MQVRLANTTERRESQGAAASLTGMKRMRIHKKLWTLSVF